MVLISGSHIELTQTGLAKRTVVKTTEDGSRFPKRFAKNYLDLVQRMYVINQTPFSHFYNYMGWKVFFVLMSLLRDVSTVFISIIIVIIMAAVFPHLFQIST